MSCTSFAARTLVSQSIPHAASLYVLERVSLCQMDPNLGW